MRLVDDDQVVVAPVDPVEPQPERLAPRAGQVGVGEDVVVEPVAGEDVGRQVCVVVGPVLGELLRRQHEHRLVAQLVVLDDRQRGERLPEAHAVGEDAAVVGLQLVDDAGRGVALEVVEALPDLRLLVAGAVVRQDVLADVVEELGEQVVEDQEVDPRRASSRRTRWRCGRGPPR